MSKKTIISTIVCLILSSFIFFFEYKVVKDPKELYRVYLAGNTIGYIEDKALLEKYIDDEQGELKTKYKVDRVYPPNDLDVVKVVTYNEDVSTEKEIYEKIKGISPFTINGYIITIKGTDEMSETEGARETDTIKINVVKKEVFDKSIKDTILSFISEDNYKNYVNGTQNPIKDTGTLIEDLYIKNKIIIKEARVSTQEKIFTNSDELDMYLLFGTTDEQKKYVVKSGDTIPDIAEKNKLNISEFLIANPDFTSENNLLYEGQEVNLGLINPLFSLVEEDHVVSIETQRFETKIEYDENILVGYDKVKQEGINGLVKVTRKIQKVNGEAVKVVTAKTETIKPVQNKIIVKGKKVVSYIANPGVWSWPTSKPYYISSGYGWRWGKLHEGIDITGPGQGSPIYAANNGTVQTSGYTSTNGNYIVIDHGNGLLTVYAHLSSRKVQAGQVVESGQLIGTMGQTGFATGTHLHFSFYKNRFITGTGNSLNPMNFY